MQRSELSSIELNDTLKGLAIAYMEALKEELRESLVAVALFGSVACGGATAYSDIDLLVIASNLPEGRLARQCRLERVDELLEARLQALRQQGILTDFSPLLKTPQEAARVIPLYFDLLQDVLILKARLYPWRGVRTMTNREMAESYLAQAREIFRKSRGHTSVGSGIWPCGARRKWSNWPSRRL